jgi:spoIIIJ-associated protein
MRSIESEADTIDEAIAKALEILGAGRDQVEVEIVSDAAKGLFGFGGRKARVRVTVRAPLMAALIDRLPAGHPDDSRETRRGTHQVEAPSAPVSDAFRERARAILTELLSHLGLACTIAVRSGDDPGTLVLAVSGDGGGLLIGRRGQTLDALEYILNRMVAREDGDSARVIIDVERYRERRQEYLTTLAHRLADKVRQTGRVVTLNPMSPRDRRVVHMVLHGDAAVTTRSQGDGHYRRVLILPADRPRRSRQADRSGD